MRNIKLEVIIDGLVAASNKVNVELTFEPAFDKNNNESIIIENVQTGAFGLIGVRVEEYPEEDISFFTFNNDLYSYARAEGFSRKDMTEKPGFKDKVLKKVDLRQFGEYILNN